MLRIRKIENKNIISFYAPQSRQPIDNKTFLTESCRQIKKSGTHRKFVHNNVITR